MRHGGELRRRRCAPALPFMKEGARPSMSGGPDAPARPPARWTPGRGSAAPGPARGRAGAGREKRRDQRRATRPRTPFPAGPARRRTPISSLRSKVCPLSIVYQKPRRFRMRPDCLLTKGVSNPLPRLKSAIAGGPGWANLRLFCRAGEEPPTCREPIESTRRPRAGARGRLGIETFSSRFSFR
jgi:hypothetical protein